MQQLLNVWSGLDGRRRIVVILASATVFISVLIMSRLATAPNLTLLYAGLESGSAGDVVQSLEQRGVEFQVRGGSIYVPAAQRDELRLTLASEGLPMTGGRGYELLDSLNGFGTTSQMFDAAYWRAKEGELARTIVGSPFVAQARVHLANTGSNPFQRSLEPSASVSVVPAGVPITAEQANALRYLVASAVAGLTIENVAVIDANGGVVGAAEDPASPTNGEDRAQILRERVQRLIEARVGPGNAVVEVSVDTVHVTESIRERRFDPESRVAISTETEERTDSSKNQANGDVTVASNLPDGDAAAGDASSAQASETRERVNYEVSETEREILRAPGEVKRLTVAVLVNGLPGLENFRPRPAEELEAMRDLVASAVGYQEERGDVITIRSMDLPTAAPLGTAPEATLVERLNLDVMSLVQMAVLALVAFVLGLFVLRPILTGSNGPDASTLALPGSAEEPEDDVSIAPLTGEIDGADFPGIPGMNFGDDGGDGGLPDFDFSQQDPVERLRTMIGDRREETVMILKNWLEESGEKT